MQIEYIKHEEILQNMKKHEKGEIKCRGML